MSGYPKIYISSKSHTKKIQFGETEQVSEPDVEKMLELSDKNFKQQ